MGNAVATVLYLQAIDHLKIFLERDGIEYTEVLFETTDGIELVSKIIIVMHDQCTVAIPIHSDWMDSIIMLFIIVTLCIWDNYYKLQDRSMRIIIPAMYAVNARPLLCKV